MRPQATSVCGLKLHLLVELAIDEGGFALKCNFEMLFLDVDNQIARFEHQTRTKPELFGSEDHLKLLYIA